MDELRRQITVTAEDDSQDYESGRLTLRLIRSRYSAGMYVQTSDTILSARRLPYFQLPDQAIQLDFWEARVHRANRNYEAGRQILLPWLSRERELSTERTAELLYLLGQATRLASNPARVNTEFVFEGAQREAVYGQIRSALELLQRSSKLWDLCGDFAGARVGLSVPIEIGLCYLDLDEPKRSSPYFELARVRISEEVRFYMGRLGLLELSDGTRLAMVDEFESALEHFRLAQNHYQQADTEHDKEVLIYCNIGAMYSQMGERDQAVFYWRKAMQYARTRATEWKKLVLESAQILGIEEHELSPDERDPS